MRTIIWLVSALIASAGARPQGTKSLDGMGLPSDPKEARHIIQTAIKEQKEAADGAASTAADTATVTAVAADGEAADGAATTAADTATVTAAVADGSDTAAEESARIVLTTDAAADDGVMSSTVGADGTATPSSTEAASGPEAGTGAVTDAGTEAVTDAGTGAVTEAGTRAVTEAGTGVDVEERTTEVSASLILPAEGEDTADGVADRGEDIASRSDLESGEKAAGPADGSQSGQLSVRPGARADQSAVKPPDYQHLSPEETSTIKTPTTPSSSGPDEVADVEGNDEPGAKAQERPLDTTEPSASARLKEAGSEGQQDKEDNAGGESASPDGDATSEIEEGLQPRHGGNTEEDDTFLSGDEQMFQDDDAEDYDNVYYGNTNTEESPSAETKVTQEQEQGKRDTAERKTSNDLKYQGGGDFGTPEEVESIASAEVTLDKVYETGVKAMLQTEGILHKPLKTLEKMTETPPEVVYRFGNHNVTSRLSALSVEGMDHLEIVEVNSDLERMSLNVTFKIPKIQFISRFNAAGSISGLRKSQSRFTFSFPKKANGVVQAIVSGTQAFSSARLVHSPNDMKLAIEVLNVDITFGAPRVTIKEASIPLVLKKMNFMQRFKVAFAKLVRAQLITEVEPAVDAAVRHAISVTLDKVALNHHTIDQYQQLVSDPDAWVP